MSEERFVLMSFNFQELTGIIYDNLQKKEFTFTIYSLVNLLNKVSQSEYDLLNLRDDIYKKLDEVIKND